MQGALRRKLLISPFVERSFSLKECYAQVTLRKEMFIALFAERFKTTTLGKSQ